MRRLVGFPAAKDAFVRDIRDRYDKAALACAGMYSSAVKAWRPTRFWFRPIVTINPLAPAAIFWNNQIPRFEWAVNRLNRKLT